MYCLALGNIAVPDIIVRKQCKWGEEKLHPFVLKNNCFPAVNMYDEMPVPVQCKGTVCGY
jgi:hypothetical protein